jgi:hypothetical protein
MMTLELREPAPQPTKLKVKYVKVTNPDNAKEFIYVESNLYKHLEARASQGLNSFFGNLWRGAVGAVGGFVTGGPLGAVGGAIQGYTKGATPKAAISTNAAAGTGTITVTAPAAQVPAAVQPPWYKETTTDNTMLYVGLAALAAVALSKK